MGVILSTCGTSAKRSEKKVTAGVGLCEVEEASKTADCRPPASAADASKRHKEIEKQLAAEAAEKWSEIKILLLGTAGCGKSTVFKQMRIVHMDGFSELDVGHYRALIQNNAIQAMAELIREAHARNLSFDATDFEAAVGPSNIGIRELSPELALLMERLWCDPAIRDLYARRDEFPLMDSAAYFLNKVVQVAAPCYRPTHADILHSRIPTTGATQIDFAFRNSRLRMTDVGGNRSEMKKWIHFFDDVDSVLFISALSDYDQWDHDYEVPVNKLSLSLEVFSRICATPQFAKAALLLFLNKLDIFEEKVARRRFADSHKSYSGSQDSDAVKKHIRKLFSNVAEEGGHLERLYAHFTNATDTENVSHVFDASLDLIIEENMKGSGFS